MSINTFQSLGLRDTIVDVTKNLFFTEPTEIQKEAIPALLRGKSMIGQSKTGSGKTHAYLLPLLNELDEQKDHVQYVITTPTRELALQIFEEVRTMTKLAEKEEVWRTRLITGGMDRERMMKQLESTTPHIVIGTPGRVFDMVDRGVLSIYEATTFVIDEADLMFDMRFVETIDQLLVRCNEQIQIAVFSATIPEQLKPFLTKYLHHPEHIKIEEMFVPEQMIHRLIYKKEHKLIDQLQALSNVIQPYVAIMFVNSKETADELYEMLVKKKFSVGLLHGGLSNRERRRVTKAILDHRYQYIVATDLASRGIDIKGTSHVIHVEMPKEIEFYIHRSGRTARAGLSGTVISFYTETDISLIENLEKRGVRFEYYDIKNDAWVKAKRYDARSRRKTVQTELDKEAWRRVRKPKRVKPGYKKKMRQEQEKIKRQLQKKRRRKK